jgi:predicted DNA-binding transcriptional regulator YafY
MRRADRLFRLVQLLRARRFATGEQLADELGVSKRTVYRDMRDLEASGVPVRGEAGVGYRLERGFELPPLTFSSEELEGLVLGARIVATWGDPELAVAVASAMTKVEAAVPEALRRVFLDTALFAAMTKVEAAVPEALRRVFLDTALFAPGFPSAAAMVREIGLLRRAISERRYIHFAYTRADGAETRRDARPLGLYFWGRWCELRQDYRSFRPDRMQGVTLLDASFDDSDGISLAEFVERMEEADRERGYGDAQPLAEAAPRAGRRGSAS